MCVVDTLLLTHATSFPRDFPDTLAGERLWQTEADAQQAEHLRKPKSKRFLHEKHGVESPFQPNWKQLFPFSEGANDEASRVDDGEDGDAESEDALCVLRGEQYMQPFCFFKPRGGDVSLSSDPPKKIPVAMRTLVRVVLRVLGRGNLELNAMVRCSPLSMPMCTECGLTCVCLSYALSAAVFAKRQ